jgi:hypothetical protein
MAGTLLSAHTRLVPALRRADTRAKTEPRSVARPVLPPVIDCETVEYPRTFEAGDAGRESVPYLELEIETEPQTALPDEGTTAKRPALRLVKTVSRKIGVGTAPEQALPAASKAVDPDEHPTAAIAKHAIDELDERKTEAVPKLKVVDSEEELDLSTERVVKMLATLTPTQPDPKQIATQPDHVPIATRPDSETEPNGPAPRPSRLQWLGVVLTQPEVGAALMIGTWLRPEFCITSPVTHVVPRGHGVLVQTTTKSRYFVSPDGDTYLVRKAPQGKST